MTSVQLKYLLDLVARLEYQLDSRTFNTQLHEDVIGFLKELEADLG